MFLLKLVIDGEAEILFRDSWIMGSLVMYMLKIMSFRAPLARISFVR
jgi:hypothetical protein